MFVYTHCPANPENVLEERKKKVVEEEESRDNIMRDGPESDDGVFPFLSAISASLEV